MLSAVQEIYHDKFSYTTKPKAEWYTKTGVVYFLYCTKHHCIRYLSHTTQPPCKRASCRKLWANINQSLHPLICWQYLGIIQKVQTQYVAEFDNPSLVSRYSIANKIYNNKRHNIYGSPYHVLRTFWIPRSTFNLSFAWIWRHFIK